MRDQPRSRLPPRGARGAEPELPPRGALERDSGARGALARGALRGSERSARGCDRGSDRGDSARGVLRSTRGALRSIRGDSYRGVLRSVRGDS